ncbi:methionine/alanine import family NSS transporter small subunit [Sutcliffiella rhizosphaerae]|uniref:Methionine/alanine import family NSS transporter small subunit n=1 Tax=Sutcliffiella rhizosphaerae TaxID=2880967 RepID=A0ABM8YMG3_9BACI|nr:methionine/alanine import family NSS transporter small subunit [Sutcliffiella rhizosphaerae]CAG9621073.1 hypothetical protein BACCIP111883_01845 [Sutcliffiella rhizosphaerae]
METSAIIMMIVGMAILWGGFAGSILWAIKKGKEV